MATCTSAGCLTEATTTVPSIPVVSPVPADHPDYVLPSSERLPACDVHETELRQQGVGRRLLPLLTGRVAAEAALERVDAGSPGAASAADLQTLAWYATDWEELAKVADEKPQPGWDVADTDLRQFIARIDAALQRAELGHGVSELE
jgi:hypothetical protein